MFNTIKSTLTALSSTAVIMISGAVLFFSLTVHEQLYTESVKADLNGLSENMSNDLPEFLASEQADVFGITSTLLRLDRYDNVKYALVLDSKFQQLGFYGGNLADHQNDAKLNIEQIKTLSFGMLIDRDQLIAHKRIGEQNLLLGHLIIVNDLSSPLKHSKNSLLSKVLPFVLIVILVGIFAMSWLNARLLSPFSALAKLAHQIKKTNNYALDINVKGKKEVKDLSTEFSAMMQTIHIAEIKNKKHNETLTQQRKHMEHLANYDSLTELPNRHFFMVQLEATLSQAAQDGTDPALFYIDLDGFKAINDTYGHDIGDKLLVEVSHRISAQKHADDILARLGGDEFIVLFNRTQSESELARLSDSMLSNLSSTYFIEGWEIGVSASIGFAMAHSADFEASRLLGNSDVAMYRSKIKGKNLSTMFSSEMMEANKRTLLIANSLPSAIKDNEFTLFYQAKVDKHHKVVGFEALIRWTNKTLGFVPPDEFIKIAEKSGRVHLITHWVIKRACMDLEALMRLYGNDVVLSLNLSSLDLKLPTLADDITKLYKRYNVAPKNMEFEITESAYLENFSGANNFFEGIKEIGSSIALDDFGTGYSSLSYLTQINIDTLKIDKQFVDQLGVSKRNTLVTRAIIELATQLNLHICAEGVETLEQAEFLLKAGCHTLQGYYFARPAPLTSLIEQHTNESS